eukprot:scaffold124949_cov26-Tisochrysis_lutea.AAC.2
MPCATVRRDRKRVAAHVHRCENLACRGRPSEGGRMSVDATRCERSTAVPASGVLRRRWAQWRTRGNVDSGEGSVAELHYHQPSDSWVRKQRIDTGPLQPIQARQGQDRAQAAHIPHDDRPIARASTKRGAAHLSEARDGARPEVLGALPEGAQIAVSTAPHECPAAGSCLTGRVAHQNVVQHPLPHIFEHAVVDGTGGAARANVEYEHAAASDHAAGRAVGRRDGGGKLVGMRRAPAQRAHCSSQGKLYKRCRLLRVARGQWAPFSHLSSHSTRWLRVSGWRSPGGGQEWAVRVGWCRALDDPTSIPASSPPPTPLSMHKASALARTAWPATRPIP